MIEQKSLATLIMSRGDFKIKHFHLDIDFYDNNASMPKTFDLNKLPLKIIHKNGDSRVILAHDKRFLLFFCSEIENSFDNALHCWTNEKRKLKA